LILISYVNQVIGPPITPHRRVRRRRTKGGSKNELNLSCISCTGDEGRPFEVGFQEQASNHSKLLRSKAVGGEHWSQSTGMYPGQVWVRETNVSEPLLKRRKGEKCSSKPGASPSSGISLSETWQLDKRRPAYRRRDSDSGSRVELREPSALMKREKHKWHEPRGESTDAERWGGPVRRSDDGR